MKSAIIRPMQSKKHSLFESFTNIAIGLVINVTAQFLIFPMFDIDIDPEENIAIAVIFTVISLCRSYAIRRWYTKHT